MSRSTCARGALGVGLVLAFAVPHAHGVESAPSISSGMEYSNGAYGGTDDIEELYVPLTGTIYFDRVALSVTVPYLSVRAPTGTTITTAGSQPVPGAGEIITQSGLGDVVLGVTVYDVFRNVDKGIALDITGKVKIGSADPDKVLGTGEEDYLLRADLYKFFDRFALMASGGYKLRGDPPGLDLKNGFLGSFGGSYALNDGVSVGLIYDFRESSLPDNDALSEITIFTTHRLSDSWYLQLYAFGGFGNSSPDLGAGMYVSVK